ncbi:MAG TPA: hypothetical protein VI168_02375 [Croceibacterium sp.]
MLARLLLAALALLLAPMPAAAQQLISGSWALRVEGTVIFRFDLARTAEGWRGTWVKPASFATDGALYANLSGPPVEQRSQSGRLLGEWIELTFGDARPGAVPDVFRFRLVSLDRVEAIYVDTGQAPLVLEQVEAATTPGPWEDGRVYRREGVEPGMLVRYNASPRAPPRPVVVPVPTPAPSDPARPPAVIGR